MTVEIKLCGKSTLSAYIDAADYEMVSRFKWYQQKQKGSRTFYAMTQINGTIITMHRLIMNHPKHGEVNHIDGNGLNNQRSNLEVVSHRENILYGISRRAYDEWKAHESQ